MELEFPEFVLLLLVAIGLLAFGPHFSRDRIDRMAAATPASPCLVASAANVACTAY